MNATNDPIYTQASRKWEEEPEDPIDWLADKPKGVCPWDNRELIDKGTDFQWCFCNNWNDDLTEDENRARYARQCEDDAKIMDQIDADILEALEE